MCDLTLLVCRVEPFQFQPILLTTIFMAMKRARRGFLFRRCQLAFIEDICNLNSGKTDRTRYKWNRLTETYILLRILSIPCRWTYLDKSFSIHASSPSEVYWKVLESLYNTFSNLITTFRSYFMAQCENLYAEAMSE